MIDFLSYGCLFFDKLLEKSELLSSSQGGVKCITKSVTEEVKGQHQQADENRWEQNHVGISEQECLSGSKKCTNAGKVTGGKVDNTKVAKACLREDNAGNYKYRAGDKCTNCVGEDMLKHNSAVVRTKSSRNENILLILETVELHSCSASHTRPSGKEEGYKQNNNV